MALVKGICGIEEKWEHLRIRSKKLFSEKKTDKVLPRFLRVLQYYQVLCSFTYFSLFFTIFP